jgi:Zn-finger nucleic acid-binding protein
MSSHEGYICPACRKPLETVRIRGVDLEACTNGCGGIWFDAAELFRLDEPEEGEGDPVLARLLARSSQSPSGPSGEKRICLKCGAKMKNHEHREGSGIFIDECYACGGIWLDGGELKAIRENPVVRQSNEERARLAREFSQKVQEEKQRLGRGGKPPARQS